MPARKKSSYAKGQLDLFEQRPNRRNRAAAIAARDEAIERVGENANAAWKERAYQAVLRAARTREDFTTDDVWEFLDADDRPHEPRAMGAIMQDAKRAGVIEAVRGAVRQSEHATCHARPKQVWKACR
jgi:hypothetical protein